MLPRLREYRRLRDEYGDVQARWLVPGGYALDVAARAVPWVLAGLTLLLAGLLAVAVR